MSIQDDIFDVTDALKATDLVAFDRLMTIFGQLEEEVELLRTENSILKQAIRLSTQPPAND